jgi:hypothetical protein
VTPYLVEKQPMLQLNKSQATNTNAVYPDVLAPAGTTQVLLDFTQTINKNTTSNVIATLANTVSAANPWLVIQLTGSSVPSASGQYDVKIYEFTQASTLGTWIAQNTLWASTANQWNGAGSYIKGTLLSTERAYVSGSNEYSVVQYQLPTNGGYYYTYNYP